MRDAKFFARAAVFGIAACCYDCLAMAIAVHAIFGPAGAGKSTLGAAMAKFARARHIELDRFPLSGVEEEGLAREWRAFLSGADARPLAATCAARAAAAGAKCVVLTAVSIHFARPDALAYAKRAGIHGHVLFGAKEECIRRFVEREKANGRGLDEEFWRKHNASYERFAHVSFAPWRIAIEKDGAPVAVGDLVATLLAREGAK